MRPNPRFPRRPGALTFILLAASACQSDDGGYDVPPDAICETFLTAWAEGIVAHCDLAPSPSPTNLPDAVARSRLRSGCEAVVPAALRAGALRLDESEAQTCLDQLRGQCSQDRPLSSGRLFPPFCAGVFTPTLGPGADCYSDAECAEGYCAEQLAAACGGTCRDWAVEGGACERSSMCAPGMACLDGTCRTRSGEGSACGAMDRSDECEAHLRCIAGSGDALRAGLGVCAQPGEDGAPCFSHSDCRFGLHCAEPEAGAEGRCARWPAGEGYPCGHDSHCPLALQCLVDGTGVAACRRPAALGEGCFKQHYWDVGCLEGFCGVGRGETEGTCISVREGERCFGAPEVIPEPPCEPGAEDCELIPLGFCDPDLECGPDGLCRQRQPACARP